MVNVTDHESLEKWLEGKPHELSVAIATRAAMRVFPEAIGVIENGSQEFDVTVAVARALLVSSLAANSLTENIRQLAIEVDTASYDTHSYISAIYAADSAVDSSSTAYKSAAYAAASAAASWKSIPKDLTAFDEGADVTAVLAMPLWEGENPFSELWQEKRNYLSVQPVDWSFWIDWYQRILDGRPQNWKMLEEIALIDPEDWDKGAEHVNGMIAGIQARYLREATPYSENIEVNPNTGKLRAIPNPMDNERLYQTALDKVRDAVDDLRPDGTLAQHHAGLEKVVKRLDRTLDRYSSNPQRVHDDFLLSAKQITTLLETTEVAKDEDVDALQSSLLTGADDIRAADAEVKASVAARGALKLEEMRVEDTESIAEAVEMLAAESEGELKDNLEDDASSYREIIVNWPEGDVPPLGGASHEESVDRFFRTAAQASRIIPVLKAGNGFVITAATSYSVTDMLIKLGDLVTILIKLFF